MVQAKPKRQTRGSAVNAEAAIAKQALQRAKPALPPALPSRKKQSKQASSSRVSSQVASSPVQQASAHEKRTRQFSVRSPFAFFPFPRLSSHSFPAHARNFRPSKLDQVR